MGSPLVSGVGTRIRVPFPGRAQPGEEVEGHPIGTPSYGDPVEVGLVLGQQDRAGGNSAIARRICSSTTNSSGSPLATSRGRRQRATSRTRRRRVRTDIGGRKRRQSR